MMCLFGVCCELCVCVCVMTLSDACKCRSRQRWFRGIFSSRVFWRLQPRPAWQANCKFLWCVTLELNWTVVFFGFFWHFSVKLANAHAILCIVMTVEKVAIHQRFNKTLSWCNCVSLQIPNGTCCVQGHQPVWWSVKNLTSYNLQPAWVWCVVCVAVLMFVRQVVVVSRGSVGSHPVSGTCRSAGVSDHGKDGGRIRCKWRLVLYAVWPLVWKTWKCQGIWNMSGKCQGCC